ncbi:MAG: hypothetical protein JHC93_07910 [Parachlamydiales bacterium]|nr:hypothetical protein [Parachlamydiales bacterium]
MKSFKKTKKVEMKLKYVLILSVIFMKLSASNFHDHLFSIPFAKNFSRVASSIFRIPSKELKLTDFFKNEDELTNFIEVRWGKPAALIFTHQGGFKQSLIDLCLSMPGDPSHNLERILTLESNEKTAVPLRQKEYIAIEDMRKKILLALPADDFEEVYRGYFRSDPLCNRRYISAAVTRRFFTESQDEKRERLMALAIKENTRLVYRVSLQREELMDDGVKFPNHVMDLLLNKSIGAIDVVGSLRENQYSYPDVKLVQSRIRELFDFVRQHHISLVFHLFETCNNDNFYQGLEDVLRLVDRPLQIEVGHIARLDDRWIDIFASNPNLDMMFHVNVVSNMRLHGLTIEKLRETVFNLRQKGFKVVPGSDGRGILPSSSYVEQKVILACPLDDIAMISARCE